LHHLRALREPGAIGIYSRIRQCGNPVVLLSLSLCLVVRSAEVGLLGAYLAACFLASRTGSFWESVDRFDRNYRQSDCGMTYIVIVIYFALNFLTVLYHGDRLNGVETSALRLIIAYTILYHIGNFRLDVIFLSAAIGALLSGMDAFYDFYFLDIARPGGATNPIRFGMIAGLFSIISLVGFLSVRKSAAFSVLMLAGAVGGIFSTILSGSRGAVVAMPLMLFLLLCRVWYRSRPRALAVVVLSALVVVPMAALEAGKLRERTTDALEDVSAMWQGGELKDVSVRNRMRLLGLSYELFREHPLLGVGTRGWEAEVSKRVQARNSETALSVGYNQAHNQFANDFAKGGLVLGFAGAALIFVPLYFFAGSRPYGDGEESLAAFLGLVTTVGFAAFCLTESVMVLNLPSCIYAILLCYLMAAKAEPTASDGWSAVKMPYKLLQK
jgi:O-antigen ligase